MQEDEIERRVVVSDGEWLRRSVHSEEANASVGFVSGVELQQPTGRAKEINTKQP